MKELEILKIINRTLNTTQHIGDDCAYLKEFGIVITQDSLIENIHFSLNYTTPYKLGAKSALVNISDVLASGATPKYLTIALSLPKTIDNKFIEEFYKGINDTALKFDIEIIGGDITGSEKNIFISICAIGSTKDRNISSRANAKEDYVIITSGEHGSSAAGLYLLKENIKTPNELIEEHLIPNISKEASELISKNIQSQYAMMDSSDGIVDAVFKIAQASNLSAEIDLDKIPFNEKIKNISSNINYKNWILYGGEDYKLIAAISKKDFEIIKNKNIFTEIGYITKKKEAPLYIKDKDTSLEIFELNNTFNHFD